MKAEPGEVTVLSDEEVLRQTGLRMGKSSDLMGFNGLSLFNGKNLIMVYHGLTMVNNHYIDRNHDRNHDSNHSNHK